MEEGYRTLKSFEGITLRMVTGYTKDSEYLVATLVPKLEAETGIKLIVDQVDHENLFEKQMMDISGNRIYDIMNPCTEWAFQYSKFAQPLNSFMGRNGYPNPELDDFIPGVWNAWNRSREIFWFPYQPDSRVFYYRSDLLQEKGIKPP